MRKLAETCGVAGFWSDHDAAYAILQAGHPSIHEELERFTREKECAGDSVQFFLDNYPSLGDLSAIKYAASCFPSRFLTSYESSWDRLTRHLEEKQGQLVFVGHHRAHAANALFSSPFDGALVVTIDGGGLEGEGSVIECGSALTAWRGLGNSLQKIDVIPAVRVNVGVIWSRATANVFGLGAGWPKGHEAGTVMAMASLGDGNRYVEFFKRAMTTELALAIPSVPGQIPPYWSALRAIADRGDQHRFDIAASSQNATEQLVREFLTPWIHAASPSHLCAAGGVCLNSVLMAKIPDWFPCLESVYVPPTPHDGGLAIGAAQHLWHELLGQPREPETMLSPYLGRLYTETEVLAAALRVATRLCQSHMDDEAVLDALESQKVVAVFKGESESGRRALGHRSIFADPRSSVMKDRINSVIKHRAWFRPFAPVIRLEDAPDYFSIRQELPYMTMAVPSHASARDHAPAIVHVDGSARVQTVTERQEPWLHSFLGGWGRRTGVPILLNTSFNDRAPICETPADAFACFLSSAIDLLYFPDLRLGFEKTVRGL